MGPGVHVYALLGHFVYGATLEAVRRYGTTGTQEGHHRLHPQSAVGRD
jgi:hypothetical protein